mmetsp:Transcript_29897/g.79883  ORF Transcript_29897/g.79883 Transcript_29897/m.79883 type:complete len:238 (-) Transcript_29897:49-762(-)
MGDVRGEPSTETRELCLASLHRAHGILILAVMDRMRSLVPYRPISTRINPFRSVPLRSCLLAPACSPLRRPALPVPASPSRAPPCLGPHHQGQLHVDIDSERGRAGSWSNGRRWTRLAPSARSFGTSLVCRFLGHLPGCSAWRRSDVRLLESQPPWDIDAILVDRGACDWCAGRVRRHRAPSELPRRSHLRALPRCLRKATNAATPAGDWALARSQLPGLGCVCDTTSTLRTNKRAS